MFRNRMSHSCRSADDLHRVLWPRLDAYDCISFDVFDTLLRRRVHPPDVVKRAVALWLARRCETVGINASAEDLFQRRRTIERTCRAVAIAAGRDGEYTLDVVLDRLCRSVLPEQNAQPKSVEEGLVPCPLGLAARPPHAWLHAGNCSPDRAALARWFAVETLAYELDLERRLTAAMPGMPELLHELRAAGKRIVLCSDMYLLSAQLAELLRCHGYRLDGVPVYVSSQEGVNKESGRLFSHMLEREVCVAARALHIGDNARCDVAVPRGLGMQAIHFRNPTERRRCRRLETLSRRSGDVFWRGAYVAELCQPLDRRPPRPDFHYDYGRRQFGLPLAVFVHAAIERAAERKLDRLLFVAREGFLLKKLYEQLAPAVLPDRLGPPACYAALSRLSTSPQSVADKELLAAYLAQQGFWGHGRRVGLIDMGWKGTIAGNLRQTFADRDDFPELVGLYLGRYGAAGDDGLGDGLLFDARRRDVSERAVLECLPLFEEAARAPHGTTVGYRETAHGIEPLFKNCCTSGRAAEIVANPDLAALQQGIVDFAARYAETIGWTGYRSADVLPYVHALLTRMICLPRRDEARGILGSLRHAADTTGQRADTLGTARFRPWRLDDWRLLGDASAPRWRQGMLAHVSRSLSWAFSTANFLRRWDV